MPRIPYGVLDGRYVNTVGDAMSGPLTLPNTGLHLLDTDASHDLIISPGSDLSADRTLTLTTGDSDRTLSIDESKSLSDYLLKDGTRPLTGDWDIGDGRKIQADEIGARDAAGLKLFEDGGKGIFVEDSTGDVGIGTVVPGGNLQVEDTSPLVIIRDTNNDTAALYLVDDTGGATYGNNDKAFKLTTANGFERFDIRYGTVGSTTAALSIDRTNGNIGIGTPSPEEPLHIVKAGAEVLLHLDGSGSATSQTRLLIEAGTSGNACIMFGDSDSYGIGQIFYHNVDDSMRFVTNSVSQAIIDSSGNVGINTTTPRRKLDILDTTNPQLRLTHTDVTGCVDLQANSGGDLIITPTGGSVKVISNDGEALFLQNTVNATGVYSTLYFEDASGAAVAKVAAQITDQANHVSILEFGTRKTGAALATRMTLDDLGRLGLGCSAQRRLEVRYLDANPQFMISYAAAINCDFKVDSNGDLLIDPTGGDVTIDGSVHGSAAYLSEGVVIGPGLLGHGLLRIHRTATDDAAVVEFETNDVLKASIGLDANDHLYIDTTNDLRLLSDNINLPNQSAVSVYSSGNQNINLGVLTLVEFDTELYDTQNEFDTGTHIFTAASDGRYLVNATVLFAVDSDGDDLYLYIYVDGAAQAMTVEEAYGTSARSISASKVVAVSASEEIELYARNADHGDTIQGGNVLWTFMTITKLH